MATEIEKQLMRFAVGEEMEAVSSSNLGSVHARPWSHHPQLYSGDMKAIRLNEVQSIILEEYSAARRVHESVAVCRTRFGYGKSGQKS
jgi:hypothetical protein